MADFKKLSEVPEVEQASDSAKVILEQDGEIVRGPAPKGSGGGAVMITLTPIETETDNPYTSYYNAYLGQAVVEETMLENPRDINGNSLPKITGKKILELCQNGSVIYVQPLNMFSGFEGIESLIGNTVSIYMMSQLIYNLAQAEPGANGVAISTADDTYLITDEGE